ncbi:hypothetical protein DOY81_004275 [Sarcophaga bullata]|nr:hypothetical protein DOY81_004275 [Sarcophaga bullata]
MGYCWIFFMPVLILIEGALYLWLSIWGLVLRECDQAITHIAKQPFSYIMDLIYFYDNACGPPQIYTSATGLVTMNLTDSAEPTSNRNFIFLICYVIISTLWILTSIWCLLTCFCCGHRGVKLLSYGSWFAVVFAGCILDAVATGFNIYNMVNTTSAAKTFEFLGIIPSDAVLEFVKNYDAYFLAPSLVMACISSRIVLIWLLNLSGIKNAQRRDNCYYVKRS